MGGESISRSTYRWKVPSEKVERSADLRYVSELSISHETNEFVDIALGCQSCRRLQDLAYFRA